MSLSDVVLIWFIMNNICHIVHSLCQNKCKKMSDINLLLHLNNQSYRYRFVVTSLWHSWGYRLLVWNNILFSYYILKIRNSKVNCIQQLLLTPKFEDAIEAHSTIRTDHWSAPQNSQRPLKLTPKFAQAIETTQNQYNNIIFNSKTGSYEHLQNEHQLSGYKVSTIFHFVKVCDDP